MPVHPTTSCASCPTVFEESHPLYKEVQLDKDCWLTKCEEDEELCTALIEAEQQISRNISDRDEPKDECVEKSKDLQTKQATTLRKARTN